METLFKSSPEGLHSLDQDLLLAAEIGKTLLEKNRELEILLKSTQDYADEKAAQADFYMKQVEILRESNDSCAHACEVLESTNQNLHDKYDQVNADYKILQGKNTRLWELINNLEKKNEDLNAEVTSLQHEIDEYELKIEEFEQHKAKVTKQQKDKSVVIANGRFNDFITNEDADIHSNGSIVTEEHIQQFQTEILNLKNDITELKVQVRVEKWQKEEIDSQMQDVIQENQLLHQKIAELNKEILEWESFAQKEECYRRIAEAFAIKHNIEIEESFVHTAHQVHSNGGLSVSPTTLSKARSCEYLNRVPTKDMSTKIIQGSNIRHLVQNSGAPSNSLLSELDKEYDALVKRYEALLEKCKQDGKFTENPERTRKVQRAIQTLSLDFSKLTTPIQSPIKPSKSLAGDGCSHAGTATSTDSLHSNVGDYRMLFSQIFAKLKEAPSSNSNNSSED
ncbi:cerebellar degeneration-related protein 2-like [Clytia hemisphaerica]|uniref:Uncharacterized protein n=1 Tax=Clytia hemisphaerica TaxID=252671 RepID=A0A7M5UV72_9CNID